MSTVQQLLDSLNAIVTTDPSVASLQIIGSHGSSGVMYELGSVFVSPNDDDNYDQPADFGIDVESGTPYVRLYLGN